MYLDELKLKNFRKYQDLTVPFNSGLNVLIGQNDSGKTTIIDAIKLVIKTHAYEWMKIEISDFHKMKDTDERADKIRFELIFKGLESNEAKNFIEWLGWEGEGKEAKPILRLIYQVSRKEDRILPSEVKAGMDEDGHPLNAEAREYLKATYLRALRDAENELSAKKNSRLSQILIGHKSLNSNPKNSHHPLIQSFEKFKVEVDDWFKAGEGKTEIKDKIDEVIGKFINEKEALFTFGKSEIKDILEKLSLSLVGEENLGLGTMNRLFMAAELLHLKKDNWDGLRLCLIEELEAHLHPQVQLKVIDYLQEQCNKKENKVQIILTTHSPNLASIVDLKNIILCKDNDVYPMGDPESIEPIKPDKYTKLEKKNYGFLERFLDVTRSNLFFAQGVIIVEGMSEELLIPAIARKIGCNLVEHEVSIVNVGSTAHLHYSKIFQRNDKKILNVPVSVVADLDVKVIDGKMDVEKAKEKRKLIEKIKDQKVCTFIAKEWTLEWCLFKSKISDKFQEVVKSVHSGTADFNTTFENTLIQKLIGKERSKLDKAAIANQLAIEIEKMESINEEDEYLKYLIDAIKYACRKLKSDEAN
ncbi:AAA family ATPase [Belliella sp. DSM 111904]|uniref:AAA family ATPase n=1 Tax=Belliella filtrata TaxID=2923435 RepID=A0ABS9V0J4_9BACT|nr:AAA family ATPase [Belliella filtrata]MCH7409927.1 AAA family ATPase [Belliella filtrata]